MATQFSQWLPQNFNQGQFNPNAQDAAAALGPQPQPQPQPPPQPKAGEPGGPSIHGKIEMPYLVEDKNPWWNPFGFQRYGSAAEASGGAPPGQMTQPPQPTMPPTTEQPPILPDFTDVPPPPPPAPLASSPPPPLPTGSPFPQPQPTPFDQPQPQPQQPQLQFQPNLTQPGQGLVPQGGQGIAQQMQQVLGPERFTPSPPPEPYVPPTSEQGPPGDQQPVAPSGPPPVPVGQTLSSPPSFSQPPPPASAYQQGQTFFSPANALAGGQPPPLPPGESTPLNLTPFGEQEGMGNIRTATNMPRDKAITAAQAAAAGEKPPPPYQGPPSSVDGKTEERIIPGVDLAEKSTGPPGGAPLYDEQGNPLPLPGIPQEEMSIRRAPEEDFTAVPVETTLSAEEEAPVEVLEQPAGAYAAISSFLDNPQVQMAMLQAAKALDPKGFGGTLAVGMEPVLKGKDYQSYVSDLLSGKPPEEITSGTILSPKEKATAIKQYQGQQLVDKAESPLQKLYRDIAKTATSGEYGMAVAKMKIAAEMAKSINASTSAKDKKEVTEAYKALSDVRGKLSVDIMSADGTVNEASLTQAMLGGQQLMTPGDKEALMAAVKYLEDSGYETLGMRSLLDATDNLTQPVTTNPLAPTSPASADKGPVSIEDRVASGALVDNGDGTYTVTVGPFKDQKVKVGKDGELRTLKEEEGS